MDNKTGLEDSYVTRYNKKMRRGYTTGSCAAAAAKAATRMLLKGTPLKQIDLMTPKGILLHLKPEDIQFGENWVRCAVRKDGGDDPDATHGLLIYAKVEAKKEPGIFLDGGFGVGRVTKPGLEQPVGSAAINKVPRQMIRREVEGVCKECGYLEGIAVEISIPRGDEVAKKTFNPRLGIVGGLSILGTSGIVEPMSEDALIASIRLEMSTLLAGSSGYLLISPGNYGQSYLEREMPGLPRNRFMKCSNYIGETIDMAVDLQAKGILFVSHIGKFIKVAGGIMNTHSRNADARAEIFCSCAILAGADLELAHKLLSALTTEEAAGLLKDHGLLEATMGEVLKKIHYYLNHRAYENLKIGAILFSNEYGYLGQTQYAEQLMQELEGQ